MSQRMQYKSATDTAKATRVLTFAGFEIKDATKGEVKAIVATLGVVDRDEDIIRPGAIEDGAKVIVSAYGHDAMFGNRPAGKGTLSIVGNKVVFEGRLFLNTTDGRDTFEVLKEMGPDQEWSFGYRVLAWEVPTEDEKKSGARIVLTKLAAFEVSPVLMGAGVGTRTVALKQADGDNTVPGDDADVAATAAATAAGESTRVTAETAAAEAARVAAETAAAAETARGAAATAQAAAQAAEATRIADALAAKQSDRITEGGRDEFDRFARTMRRMGMRAS